MPDHGSKAGGAEHFPAEGQLDGGPLASGCSLVGLTDPSEVAAVVLEGLRVTQHDLVGLEAVLDLDADLASGVVVSVVERRPGSVASRDGLDEGAHGAQHADYVRAEGVLRVGSDKEVRLAIGMKLIVPDVGPVHHHELVIT